jgi:hypothetical protein
LIYLFGYIIVKYYFYQLKSLNMRNIRKKKQLPDYSVGGWLKDNWTDVAKTAGGIGAMFVPGMQTMGAGLISSGAQGMMQNAQQGQAQQQQELLAKQQQAGLQTQELRNNMTAYTPTFQSGGNLNSPYQHQKESLYNVINSQKDINAAGKQMGDILNNIPFDDKDKFYQDFTNSYPTGGKYFNLDYNQMRGDVDRNHFSLKPVATPVKGVAPLPVQPLGNPRTVGSTAVGRTLFNTQRTRNRFFADGGIINGNDMNGQYIDYSVGQDHFGPDEGIPVDAKGQPVAMSGGQAVGLTEKGEVTYNGQVFSDTNKLPGNKKRTFADEAKRIAKKYKFYLGDKLDKKEDVSRRALERELQQLFDIQEARKGNMMHQDDVEQLLQQQQEAQAQMVEQEMMQEQQMQQDPMMREQMGMEQGIPMMQDGGNLRKYGGGGNTWEERNNPYAQSFREERGRAIQNTARNVQSLPSLGIPSTMSGRTALQDAGRATDMARIANTPLDQEILDFEGPDENFVKNFAANYNPNTTSPVTGGGPTGELANNLQPMQPSPIPAMVGAGVGIANSLVGLYRNRKSQQPNLKLDRMTPERISLEEQRIAARNRGTTTGSTIRRDLARRGAGQGAFQAGSAGAMADINRGVGEQVGQSYLAEQTANMQARQQAQGINMQQANQERMFNTQAAMQRRATQDQLIASGMNAIPAAMMDYQTQVGRQNMLNAIMAQGDYSTARRIDPNAPWWRKNRGPIEIHSNEYLKSLRG